MQTINNTDIENKGRRAKLESHLQSSDFFAVSQHKSARFKSTQIKSLGYQRYKVAGNMTIKGISKNIEFELFVKEEPAKLIGIAQIKLNRTRWDINYGSKKRIFLVSVKK